MAKQNLRIVDRELAKRKPRTDQERIAMLENYVRALTPPREPVVAVSRNSIFKDGFVPGWVLIKMLRMAEERKNRGQGSGVGVRGLKDWIVNFINLGIFGKREEVDVV